MSRPQISRLNTWERFEKHVLEVFIEALLILLNKVDLPNSENELNRELYFCLLEANHKLYRSGTGGFDYPPSYEAQNPPDPEDKFVARREKKRPDFYWGYLDHSETDPRKSSRNFVFECKRLGKPVRSDWILNENYVRHGIFRFISEDYGYSKNEKSGAMIGYVQNMNFDEILAKVNKTAKKESILEIETPIAGWKEKDVSMLEQKLKRAFPIKSFNLKHLWVDLRR